MKQPQIDQHSLTWREIEAWALDQIEQAQDVLETPSLGEAPTEYQRGRIGALRELILLKDVGTEPTITGPTNYGVGA